MPFRTKKVIIELEAAKGRPEYRNFRFRNLGTLDWKEEYVIDAAEVGAVVGVLAAVAAVLFGFVDLDGNRWPSELLAFGFAVFGLGVCSLTMVTILPKPMISIAGQTSYRRVIASTFLVSEVIAFVAIVWANDWILDRGTAFTAIAILIPLLLHSAIVGSVYAYERRRREDHWARGLKRPKNAADHTNF